MTLIRTLVSTVAITLTVSACTEADKQPKNPNKNVAEQHSPATSRLGTSGGEAPQTQSSTSKTSPISEFSNLPAPYADADYALGRRIYRQCSSCHSISETGEHLIGPNLYGLFQRSAGTANGFRYSDALETANFTWTPEQLDPWLQNPRGFLPGNRMTFSGLRKPADRQAVIAYIMLEAGWSAE